ncbi:MAG: multiheme c-type cytochrome [Spirochaetota bacterium]|nr:multiheme c-type cytochrome [Spirochaetota bacterium]
MKKRNNFFLVLTFIIMLLYWGAVYAKNSTSIREKEGNSCIQCHIKLQGKLYSVVIEWEKSVHASKGNKCNICHGGNPNIYNAKGSKNKKYDFIGRPKNDRITNFCGRGKCHSKALFQFKKSPHFQSVMESGEPNCTSCHGKHNIQKSSIHIMSDETCSDCHTYQYSREILETVFAIEKDIDNIAQSLDYLKSKNAEVEDLYDLLKMNKHLFHQLVHVFSREDMEFTHKILNLEIASLKTALTTKIALVKRMELLYTLNIITASVLVPISIIFTIIVFVRRKKKEKYISAP